MNPSHPPTPARVNGARTPLSSAACAWRIVLAAYVLVFGTLLLATHGLPYAIDNNESFSSLLHARNLAQYDLAKSYGLTDESYATTAAGHPFIHSHQGNFPRLFSFVLYVLGARSIESQLWITTFTVGLAAVWFAFRFYRSLGPPAFAALACLVMVSNYTLFVQWQANTYRVWHGFFFFSSLLGVEAFLARPSRRVFLLTVLNFAALFYWEYVFGLFVAVAAALYAAYRLRRQARFLRFWTAQALGAGAAATCLVVQLSAYMGWRNVVRDVSYTLSARNMAWDFGFAEKVSAFYAEHHILFLQNFFDASAARSVSAFFHALFAKHFQHYSPWLWLGVLVLAAGWLGGSPGGRARRSSRAPDSGWLRLPLHGLQAILLVAVLQGALHAFGLRAGFWTQPGSLAEPGRGGLTAACAMAVLSLLNCSLGGSLWRWDQLRGWRWGGLMIALLGAGGALRADLFDSGYQESWTEINGGGLPLAAAVSGLGLALAFGLALAGGGNRQLLGSSARTRVVSFLPFSLCVLLAFGFVYRIFTGYIFSGYLNREVPFLVFWSDAVVALALYLVVRVVQRAARSLRPAAGPDQRAAAAGDFPRRRLVALAGAAGGAVLGLFFLAQWIVTQRGALRLIPPTHYAFLRNLEKDEFRGGSFVVNTYAAPFAVQTRGWAYWESAIFSGQLRLGPAGFESDRDLRYLWMADKNRRDDYLRPDFAAAIRQPASIGEAAQHLLLRREDGGAFQPSGLVQRVQAPAQAFLQHQIAWQDGDGNSIVRFDWDFPAFLQPVDPGLRHAAGPLSLGQKLALTQIASDQRQRWRVAVIPFPPAAGGPSSVVLKAASIDGKNLFGDDQIRAAGWTAGTRADSGLLQELRADPASRPLQAFTAGQILDLKFATGPSLGRAWLSVGNIDQMIDLGGPAGVREVSLSAGAPDGTFTYVPDFLPGEYVATRLVRTPEGIAADVDYRYHQQGGRPEANTVIRVYAESPAGEWQLLRTFLFPGSAGTPIELESFLRAHPEAMSEYQRQGAGGGRRSFPNWLSAQVQAHPELLAGLPAPTSAAALVSADGVTTRRIPLGGISASQLQITVRPGTATKAGPEYFGLPFSAADLRSPPAQPAPVKFDLEQLDGNVRPIFGTLKLRLKFARQKLSGSEPLLSTGVPEAGDFVYALYPDQNHLRIGLDHWFHGGDLSAPIAIDYDHVYELEISIGSLYPGPDHPLFSDADPAAVRRLKSTLTIKLDQQVVLQGPMTCYEAHPQQVFVGANPIKGTSSGPAFSGEILSIERVWPFDH